MAKIEFEAFVEDALSNERGVWALKTAEPHSKKDDNDQWQTVSRTFRTVKAAWESGVDLSPYGKGDKVLVWGKESTDVREYQGKKFYDLIVKADRVEPVNRGGASDQQPTSSPASDSWASTAPANPEAAGEPWAEVPF